MERIEVKAITYIYIESSTGKECKVPYPIPEGGVPLEKGDFIRARFNDREIEYKSGDIISLTPSEVNEICYIFECATDEIIKETISYTQEIGIPLDII